MQTTDDEAIYNALFTYVNAHGGAGGHPLKPLYLPEPATTYDATTAASEECSTFTEDNHVFAAFDGAGADVDACLEKAGVVHLRTFSQELTTDLTAEPHLTLVNGIALDRLAQSLPGELVQANYASSPATARVGVYTLDDPSWESAVNNQLLPGLKKAGLNVVDVDYSTPLTSTSDTAQASTDAAAAVLKFGSDRVDHVVFFDAVSAYLFLSQASSQGYYPHYAFTSNDSPSSLTAQGFPSATFAGSVVEGWQPSQDVAMAQWDSTASSVAAACIGILASAGQPESITGLYACDKVLFLKAALDRAPAATAAGFLLGEARLGSGFAPSSTFRATVSDTRHDIASAVRLATYGAGCNCFTYSSPLSDVP